MIETKEEKKPEKVLKCMKDRKVLVDYEMISLNVVASEMKKGLSEDEEIILEALFHGYAISSISKISGVSKHRIRKISNKIKEVAKDAVHS